MRRPRFSRWIRLEVLRLAGTNSFSLRKLAAKAQRKGNEELRAALLLYAHENEQVERLLSYVHSADVRQEYLAIEQHFGQRSIERLALRGTPMMSLPETYRNYLAAFEHCYHAPERMASEKRVLRDATLKTILEAGIAPSDIAHGLDLDEPNLNAYLMRGEVGRFTLDTACVIRDYANQLAEERGVDK